MQGWVRNVRVHMYVHESQRVYQNCPKVVSVGVFARIDVFIDIYRVMNDVILDDHRFVLHAAPKVNRVRE